MAYPKAQDGRVEMYEQGLTDKQIAAKLGVKKHSIEMWRFKNDLPCNRAIKHSEIPLKEKLDERMRLYNEKMTDVEIAKIQGVKTSVISNWRKRQDLPGNGKSSYCKSSKCWSCTRANANPDPVGCAFHRRYHLPVYEAAEVTVRYNHATEYKTVIVTDCKHYDLSLRDMRDRNIGRKARIEE